MTDKARLEAQLVDLKARLERIEQDLALVVKWPVNSRITAIVNCSELCCVAAELLS